jgi:VCBS repeat protein
VSHPSLRTALLRLLPLASLVAFSPSPAARAQVSFEADRVYTLRGRGGATALADVNRDGALDLCIASATADPASVSLLLGDGAGGFRHARASSTGSVQPTQLRFVDTDHDGKIDLVAVDEAEGRFCVLRGNGRGKFTLAQEYSVPEVVTDTAFADVDGDGFVDVLFHQRAYHQVTVWRGEPGGGFVAGTPILLPWHTAMIATADVDGDGAVDVVVSVPDSDGRLQILRNDGTGGFSTLAEVVVSPFPEVLAVGDVNGDGLADVIVAHNGVQQIWVLFGDGTGQLRFGGVLFGTAIGLAIDDLDADGVPDLVATVQDGVVTYRGIGGGAFDYGLYTAGGGNRGCSIGDVDGDGLRDLVLETGYPRVHRTRVNAGAGPAEIQVRELADAIVAVDLDLDGRLDLVTADPRTGTIVVRRGTSGGGFGAASTVPGVTTSDRALLVAADLQGDGRPDILVACTPDSAITTGAMDVLVNDRSAGLVPGQSIPCSGAVIGACVADFGGDRIPDLAIAHAFDQNATNPGYIDLYGGNGDGTFTPTGRLWLSVAAESIVFGDWDEDGRMDFAYRDAVRRIPASTRLHVVLHGSAGFFETATTAFPTGEFFNHLTTADVNGDGHADLVLFGGQIGARLVLGDGLGGFALQPILDDDTSTADVSVGDFDGDGTPDVATLSARFHRVGIRLGEGGEFRRAPAYFGTANRPAHIVQGDFDQDGRLDLALLCNGEFGSVVDVLRNDTPDALAVACTGRVGDAVATPAGVLCVNGTPGDASSRVTLDRSRPEAFRVQIDAPPAGPSVARYVLYAWLGEPSLATLSALPNRLGSLVFDSPLTRGRPAVVWNNLGAERSLGAPTLASPRAPTTALRVPSGLRRAALFTLQGLVQDLGSSSTVGLSATNAVIVTQR